MPIIPPSIFFVQYYSNAIKLKSRISHVIIRWTKLETYVQIEQFFFYCIQLWFKNKARNKSGGMARRISNLSLPLHIGCNIWPSRVLCSSFWLALCKYIELVHMKRTIYPGALSRANLQTASGSSRNHTVPFVLSLSLLFLPIVLVV